MKITITEIEATSDDLRASRTLAENLTSVLNNAFGRASNNYRGYDNITEEEEDGE